jgi:hypothetical protein
MSTAFEFEAGGRTYSCRLEEPRAARREAWWWFGVSGDAHRYAPFQATSGDTVESVQSLIVAFYANLLARRASPPAPRHHWWARRGKGTAAK